MVRQENGERQHYSHDLLETAVRESPALRSLIERVRFGEITLKLQDAHIVTAYVSETIQFKT